ncbi:MAG TPA: GNAT family N-acetyltransferase [Actinomycetota bacterium]|jgi:ribosomal protein S18 acetylase RimI-like enzyme
MQVREALPGEWAEAGKVTADAWREWATPGDQSWLDYLDQIADVSARADRTTILAAVDDGGRIVGTATLELKATVREDDELPPDRANVRMLGVDPSARRLGAGRALVQACIDRARAAGKTELTLMTAPKMTAAVGLYESMGFEREEVQHHHDHGHGDHGSDDDDGGEDDGGTVLLAFRMLL